MKASRARKVKMWDRLKISEESAPYYFLSLIILIFTVFMLYPIIDSFILSFKTFDKGVYSFVGLENYITMFKDPIFFASLKNTFIYLIVQVPLMIILSLGLAAILEQDAIKGKAFFRMSIFLPTITALVAYSLVFKLLLNTDYGLINYLLNKIGIENINWLRSKWPARFSIILAITWRWVGYNMIIMIAGLKAIPDELYEAADVDGANGFQKFLSITVPSMKHIILFTSITSTIGTLQLFDESFILTSGGPDNATISTGHYLYNNGFVFFKFGYAAAISYVLVMIVAILAFVQFKMSKED